MDFFGYPIWVVPVVCVGVFCASFMDAIGGGGGIISLPIYLLAGLPMHMALGTNKLSACIGTVASTVRYIKNGYANWALALPSVAMAMVGAYFGTSLQLMLDERILKQADLLLSFSKMTFPHQLMRLILVEQLYRSYRIIKGEPYHK